MSPLPERGDLADTSLPRLLLELHAARFGGLLTLTRDPIEKSFLFHEGLPVHAESNGPSESLAGRLSETGVISQTDGARVAAYVKRERCQEAKALLALQLVDPRGLVEALKEQVRLRLIDCVGWSQGTFRLDAGTAAPEGTQALRTDVYALVQEAIETHWSPDRILADLAPHMGHCPTRTHGLARVAACLRRDDCVESLLASLDGERPLWQLLQAARSPRALAAAWVLDASGAIAHTGGGNGTSARSAAPQVEIVVAGPASAERRARTAATPDRGTDGEAERRAAAALAREIDDRFQRLDQLDGYALLGIERDAAAAAIKQAYLAAAKSYHPDVIARSGLDTDTRVRANRVFAEIGKAYATLSDPERRRRYDLSLEGGGDELDAERLATAEGLFRKGDVLLRQGNFRGALEFLETAAELWPDDAAYQSALGWALYKKLPSEPERAREHLERAASLDPADAAVLFRLSVVLRTLGEAERSAAMLSRARHGDSAG